MQIQLFSNILSHCITYYVFMKVHDMDQRVALASRCFLQWSSCSVFSRGAGLNQQGIAAAQQGCRVPLQAEWTRRVAKLWRTLTDKKLLLSLSLKHTHSSKLNTSKTQSQVLLLFTLLIFFFLVIQYSLAAITLLYEFYHNIVLYF